LTALIPFSLFCIIIIIKICYYFSLDIHKERKQERDLEIIKETKAVEERKKSGRSRHDENELERHSPVPEPEDDEDDHLGGKIITLLIALLSTFF
jgi:hypothetical protein